MHAGEIKSLGKLNMKDQNTGDTSGGSAELPSVHVHGERFVYVMPQEAIQALVADEMSLLELWRILWHGKWLIIGITSMFAISSVFYALNATEWYRAEVLLAPADESSTRGLSGTLGGLASLAGVSVSGGDSVDAIAVLRSRDFAGTFIEQFNLLPVFFPGAWDAASEDWFTDADRPNLRDGVKYFSENIRTVNEDRDTGLITLAVRWKEPHLAAEWANALVEQLNDRMRQKALVEAQRNVDYLQGELGKTNVVTLQQSVGRLMESELQKLMLARGNEEFAFRVIDRAQVPNERFSPRRTLLVAMATFVGGMMAVVFILIRHALRSITNREQ